MWRDAALIAAKDLRIELRSRVGTQQVAPFALVVLVLFAFAFDADHSLLHRAAPGLFWVAVLFAAVLAVQRSFALESADGGRDRLRLSGMDPAGIFLGKAGAVAAQLLALQVLLAAGVTLLYSARLAGVLVLVSTSVVATVGLAAAGTVYGVVVTAVGASETLLPLLLLPVVAPVLLCATKAWQAALDPGAGGDALGWLRLLAVFAVVYVVAGIVAFGPLVEEA